MFLAGHGKNGHGPCPPEECDQARCLGFAERERGLRQQAERDAYDEQAADLAKEEAIQWIREHLK